MEIVTRALNVVKGTVIAIADMAMWFDSRTKLDVTVTVMLLCLLGLVIYVMPLIALFILLFVSYCVIQPIIGETENEALNKYVIRDSWNR